ncbi:hypothetical protein NPIL_340331 [Nephila pilipes]|uniref:Uncharacterized protein n=1 Tax=Nephila pilipes TaxID=299642 RepID=A0A8X6NKI4_NEPPI|nr:hypothetical protein NPIL_340331 [Nephila pilipes]
MACADYTRKRMRLFSLLGGHDDFGEVSRTDCEEIKGGWQLPPVNPSFINSILMELSLRTCQAVIQPRWLHLAWIFPRESLRVKEVNEANTPIHSKISNVLCRGN